jgi:5-formyltetrahydrofolate cyclo-ligase
MQSEGAKAALRREALARRANIASQAREAFAANLAVRGVEIGRRVGAHCVSAYWPTGSEADSRSLVQALDYHEFVTALPAIVMRDGPLVFRRWKHGDSLVQGERGIFEPAASSQPVVPGLMFVPLAAFDRRGHRLGYGAGYFDRTLASLGARSVVAVGVGFACQEVAAVPDEAHDHPLDLIITEDELIRCSAVESPT